MWLGGEWFAVIGILEPAPLAPDLDSAALIGYPVAASCSRPPGRRRRCTCARCPAQVEAVRSVLARTVDPQTPGEVDVSRPSDALEARATTDAALRNLLLGLGAVALVVGGVGITNVMVISVLERRSEIGVRRALGARGATSPPSSSSRPPCSPRSAGWAARRSARPYDALRAVPGLARRRARRRVAGGAAVALAVGLLAGVSPAIRAARLDPADAVRPQ